jgi:hypothetical protein
MKHISTNGIFKGLVALAFFAGAGVAHAQFLSGYACNRTQSTIKMTTVSNRVCQENYNGRLVSAVCGTHTGWATIAPGVCTGVTGGAVLFGAGALGYAVSDDGTVWQGAGGNLGYLVCSDPTRGFFVRNTAFTGEGGTIQYLRYDCQQSEWRNGFELKLGNGNAYTDLLPGGGIQYR